jgi:hypothetical protein
VAASLQQAELPAATGLALWFVFVAEWIAMHTKAMATHKNASGSLIDSDMV